MTFFSPKCHHDLGKGQSRRLHHAPSLVRGGSRLRQLLAIQPLLARSTHRPDRPKFHLMLSDATKDLCARLHQNLTSACTELARNLHGNCTACLCPKSMGSSLSLLQCPFGGIPHFQTRPNEEKTLAEAPWLSLDSSDVNLSTTGPKFETPIASDSPCLIMMVEDFHQHCLLTIHKHPPRPPPGFYPVAVGEQNLRDHDGVADQLTVLHRLRKAALVGGLDLIVQFLHEGRSRQVDQLLRTAGVESGWKQEQLGKQKEEPNVKCS